MVELKTVASTMSRREYPGLNRVAVVILRLCKPSQHSLPFSSTPSTHAHARWVRFLTWVTCRSLRSIRHMVQVENDRGTSLSCICVILPFLESRMGWTWWWIPSPQPWWDINHRAVSQTDPNNTPALVRTCEPLGLINYLLPNYIPSPASSFSFTTYLSTKSCSRIYMASSVVFLLLFEQVHALLNVKFSLFHHLGCSIQRHCTVLYGSLKGIISTHMHTY